MMEPVYILAGIGLTFNLLAGIGLIRFPDVYNRLHAATLATTFGTIFIALAIITYAILQPTQSMTMMALHTLVAVIALLVTNPTASHAIAKAAHKAGVKPIGEINQYKGVKK